MANQTNNKCRKFEPNMFNKNKCQSCFKPKEQHSAEALECSKIARKISKCGYLFVAPDSFDFNSPLDKSRRWQRRFVVLYDDGELTYSVDDNVNTVPQGTIDMNRCTDVFDAENVTTHQFSIAVVTPDNSTYIKGTAKDEITRWYDVLVMYPRSNKTKKTRRTPPYAQKTQPTEASKGPSLASTPAATTTTTPNPATAPPHPSYQPRYPSATKTSSTSSLVHSVERPAVARTRSIDVLAQSEVVPPAQAQLRPAPAPMTYRGVRSLKHKNDKTYKLQKSNSMHDLTEAAARDDGKTTTTAAAEDTRYRSRSRDPPPRRRRTDPGHAAVQEVTAPGPRSPTSSLLLLNGRNKNETDERKMAKSSDLRSAVADDSSPRASPSRQDDQASGGYSQDDLINMKKGWLLQQGPSDKDWNKHWFVLSGSSLKYYQDSWAEETQNLDGVIDLSSCRSVKETNVSRNYGFRVKTNNAEYVLSAMTSGIRVKWIQALEKCMENRKAMMSSPERKTLMSSPDRKSTMSSPDRKSTMSSPDRKSTMSSPDRKSTMASPDRKSTMSSNSSKEHNAPSKPTYAWSPQSQKRPQESKSESKSAVSASKDGSLMPRRLTMDSIRSEQPSSSSAKNHKHRASCTWPYVSPERDSGSEGQKSEVAEMVKEQDREQIANKSLCRQSQSDSFEKFRDDVGGAGSYERDRRDSGSSYGSSPSQRRHSRSKSPRAPSAKVKDRSRAKSPRPKSPPLSVDETDHMVDLIVQQGEENDRPPDDDDDDAMNDIIEKKWREIQDIQDEMESTTEFYKKKLGDQDNRAQLAKLQVQTLREQLKEARETIKQRDDTIRRLQAQLDSDNDDSSVSSNQAALNQAILEAKDEAESWKEKARALEAKIKEVQKELKEAEAKKTELEKASKVSVEEVKKLRREVGVKADRIEVLEAEVDDSHGVRQELSDKEETICDLQQEISVMKKQLREQDEVLERHKQDTAKLVKQMEDEFYAEKEKLETHIEQLQKRMDDTSRQHDLSDTLNSDMADILREKDETIAQLEEKLIEHDNKIEEVQEEMKIEIEDNTKLQQSLDQAYTDKTALKRELEEAKTAIEMLEHELAQVGQQNQSLSMNKTDLQKEMEQLRKRNKELNAKVNEIEQENGTLKMVIDEQGADLENWEDKYQTDIEDLKQLVGSEGSNPKVEEFEEELHSVYGQLETLHKEHEELKNETAKEHENSQKIVDDLKAKLKNKEKLFDGQSQQVQKLVEARDSEKDMVSEKDYEELKKKLTSHTKDLTQVKHRLKESEVRCEELTSENASYKEQVNSSKSGTDAEMNKLQEKLTEVQGKLGVAERRVKRFEARRRSGGFDEKEDSPPPQAPDPALASKVQALEQELKSSQALIKDHKKKLLEQRSLQVELGTLRQSEQRLKKQNEEFVGQLESYKQNAGPECYDEIRGKLAEVQIKMEKTQSTVQECRCKVADILKALPKSNALSGKLQQIHSELAELLEDAKPSLAAEDRIRIYRERVALEALVLGEMAYLVRSNDTEIISEKEQLLAEIEEGNHRITLLEQTVAALQGKESQPQKALSENVLYSLQMYSRLLADKMLLQDKMAALMAEKQEQLPTSPRTLSSHSQTAEHLAQKALFKTKIGERLHTTHQSSQVREPTSSLASQSLVQGQLTFVLEKLETKAAENVSQKEKVEYVQTEITQAKSRLLERQASVESSVESLRQKHLSELATVIVTQVAQQAKTVGQSPSKSDKSQVKDKSLDREFVQSEVTVLVNKYTEMYERQLPVDTSSQAARRNSLIEEYVQKEIKQNVDELVKKCEQELKNTSDVDNSEDTESRKTDLLLKFADLLAQRAILAGQVAYVNLRTEEHAKSAGSLAKLQSKKAVKRHDSGIMVHGASLPTSPTEQLEQIDHSELAERLQKEAAVKSEIATFLENNSSNGSGQQSKAENLDAQITRLAAEMAQVDLTLLQGQISRRQSKVCHFAEVLSNEAAFQAQVSYIVNTLKLKHKQEVDQLRMEFDTAEEQRRNKSESQVGELEEEIHRLSTLLTENESQFKRTVQDARMSASDNQDEIVRKKTLHKQEIQSLKDGYEIRIRSLQSDLEGLRGDLDKLQQERYDDITSYEKKVDRVEQELRTVRREKDEMCQAKDDDIQAYGDKVGTLEEELTAALNKVDSPRAQASKDTTEEVKKLRAALAEEKSRHMAELLRLREEVSGEDQDAAAQSVLNSRIQQLEEQIHDMQADYEQELTLTKSAHRRELARSKDDLLDLLAQAEAKSLQLDEGAIRRRYVKELDKIKEIYDRGFSSMEKSHQKVLMEMRKAHKREMEALRREKDQLLDEETKATQSALDAMRKAHEAELQKERSKFLDMLAKTYSHADVETLQKQHEEDLQLIQHEISQLSEEYSVKCLELASMEERLDMQTKALAESRKRTHDLRARNDELNMRIKHELEKLNRLVNKPATSTAAKDGDSQEVAQLKVAMKVKDTEVKTLGEELDAIRTQLKGATEELEDSLEKNHELFTDRQAMRRQYEKELQDIKRKLAEKGTSNSPRENPDEEEEEEEQGAQAAAALFSRSDTPCSTESEGSPCPKRSKLRQLASLALQGSSSGSEAGSRPTSAGRQLPAVSEEARTNKKALWRQRHPERARSNPGPIVMTLSTSSAAAATATRFHRRLSSQMSSSALPSDDI